MGTSETAGGAARGKSGKPGAGVGADAGKAPNAGGSKARMAGEAGSGAAGTD